MITANLPLYTMRSFVDGNSNATYTVMTLQTNMKDHRGKPMTHYMVHIIFQSGDVKEFSGYSSKHHMDVFSYAKGRARNYLG